MGSYSFSVGVVSEKIQDLEAFMQDLDKAVGGGIIKTAWDSNKQFLRTLGTAFAGFTSEVTETADINHQVMMRLQAFFVRGHKILPHSSQAVIDLKKRQYGPEGVEAVMIELFNFNKESVGQLFVKADELADFVLKQLPKQLVDLYRVGHSLNSADSPVQALRVLGASEPQSALQEGSISDEHGAHAEEESQQSVRASAAVLYDRSAIYKTPSDFKAEAAMQSTGKRHDVELFRL
jgi:hypothetical protein